jgi:hypothetical protein
VTNFKGRFLRLCDCRVIIDHSLLSFGGHFNLQPSIENSKKQKLIADFFLLSLRPPSNLPFDVEPEPFSLHSASSIFQEFQFFAVYFPSKIITFVNFIFDSNLSLRISQTIFWKKLIAIEMKFPFSSSPDVALLWIIRCAVHLEREIFNLP